MRDLPKASQQVGDSPACSLGFALSLFVTNAIQRVRAFSAALENLAIKVGVLDHPLGGL